MKAINYITLAISICCICLVIYSFKPEGGLYEFKTITVVESIVPNGLGRSRMIETLEVKDYKEFSKVMSEDDNERNKSDRGDIRAHNYEETKLLNFFNIGGIRFQNIAANDAIVNSRVSQFLDEGWEIVSINSGVESVGSADDNNGLFITRFYFKKQMN
jgi:hypothetical protein